MRIHCPFCGERDLTEFVYWGDASYARPDAGAADAPQRFIESVYLRDNPAGAHAEMWYHSVGCRTWLRVMRDTRTHEIASVEIANQRAGG